MNALAETIRNTYKLQIHRGTGKAIGFCVGGAACHYLADSITWDEIYTNPDVTITDSMKKFPHYSSVGFYAGSIVQFNDEGDFPSAWQLLSDFFDEYELSECGECGELKQGDARAFGGMRCGQCAYG
jgi:hypothetical protein